MSETPSSILTWNKTKEIKGYSSSLKWSPDGKMFVAASNSAIIVVNVEDMSIKHNIEVTSDIHRVTWSPKKNIIAACFADGFIKLWDPEKRNLLLTIEAQPPEEGYTNSLKGVTSIAFSPDGNKIVSGSGSASNESNKRNYRPVKIWDISDYNTMKGVKTIPLLEMKTEKENMHTSEVHTVEWRMDENYILSCCKNSNLNIWNSTNGELFKELKIYENGGHKNDVFSAAWNKSNINMIATGSRDLKIIIWNFNDNTIYRQFEELEWVRHVTFSPDGTMIASGTDAVRFKSHINVWNVSTGNKLSDLECRGNINSMEFSPYNNKILLGLDDSIDMLETTILIGGVSYNRSIRKGISNRKSKYSNKKRKNIKKRKSYRKFYKKAKM